MEPHHLAPNTALDFQSSSTRGTHPSQSRTHTMWSAGPRLAAECSIISDLLHTSVVYAGSSMRGEWKGPGLASGVAPCSSNPAHWGQMSLTPQNYTLQVLGLDLKSMKLDEKWFFTSRPNPGESVNMATFTVIFIWLFYLSQSIFMTCQWFQYQHLIRPKEEEQFFSTSYLYMNCDNWQCLYSLQSNSWWGLVDHC